MDDVAVQSKIAAHILFSNATMSIAFKLCKKMSCFNDPHRKHKSNVYSIRQFFIVIQLFRFP